MTGPELRTIRKSLGLSLYRLGRALGYQGNRHTVNGPGAQIRKERQRLPAVDRPPFIDAPTTAEFWRKLRRFVIQAGLLLLVSGATSPVAAGGTYTHYGHGMQSCGSWLQARKEPSSADAVYVAWLGGYI